MPKAKKQSPKLRCPKCGSGNGYPRTITRTFVCRACGSVTPLAA